MSSRLEHEIREWLEGERDGSDELAEGALTRAFAELGRRSPAPAFADRVLLRAGLLMPAPVWRRRWLHGAVAASLVAAGLALTVLPVIWLVVVPLLRGVASPLLSELSHAAPRAVAGVLAFWNVAADLGSALRTAAVTPTAMAVVVANVLLAMASLLGLKRLLKAPEESMPW